MHMLPKSEAKSLLQPTGATATRHPPPATATRHRLLPEWKITATRHRHRLHLGHMGLPGATGATFANNQSPVQRALPAMLFNPHAIWDGL